MGSPFLFHVRLTLKKTVAAHEAAIDEIVEKAKKGWVPVSGFISPGEKEALRRLKAAHAFRRNCLEMNEIAAALCGEGPSSR